MNRRNTEFHKSFAPDADIASRCADPAAETDRPIEQCGPILTGVKQSLTLRVYHAMDIPPSVLRDHECLLTETRLIYPAALRNVSFEQFRKGDYIVASVSANSELLARVHAVRIHEEGGTCLKFGGLASRGGIGGAAQTLIAATIIAEEHDTGSTPSGEAIARHSKSTGELNLASTIPFSRVGFYGARTTQEPVNFDDIHMFDEWTLIDGQPHVGCHLMQGKAKDIGPRSWDVLSYWNLTFGKSRMEDENTFFFGKEQGDE